MPKLTPYEIERLENIKRNEELMKSLGIFQPDITANKSKDAKTSSSKSIASTSKVERRQSTPISSTSATRVQQVPRRSARFSKSRRPSSSIGINSDPIDFLTENSSSASSSKRQPVLLKQLPAPTLSSVDEVNEEQFDPDYRAPLPERDEFGTLLFEGRFGEFFRPNMTPEEVLRAGSFGGTFFREHRSFITNAILPTSDYLSLPTAWTRGLNPTKYLTSHEYDPATNKYGVRAGQSLAEWERAGWVMAQDPRGWFQWYCHFFEGRRSADDWRQIKRWQGVASVRGRFRTALVKRISEARGRWDDESISPITRQTLQHWAYRLTEDDYEAYF